MQWWDRGAAVARATLNSAGLVCWKGNWIEFDGSDEKCVNKMFSNNNVTEGGFPGFYTAVDNAFGALCAKYGLKRHYEECCELGPCVGYKSDTVWLEVCLDHRAGEIDLAFNQVEQNQPTYEPPFRLREIVSLQREVGSNEGFIRWATSHDGMVTGLTDLAQILSEFGDRFLQGDSLAFEALRMQRANRMR